LLHLKVTRKNEKNNLSRYSQKQEYYYLANEKGVPAFLHKAASNQAPTLLECRPPFTDVYFEIVLSSVNSQSSSKLCQFCHSNAFSKSTTIIFPSDSGLNISVE
jgi:hypothetical protein